LTPDLTGPAYSYDKAAEYLDCSQRQVRIFEELGELKFFTLGPKMKRVTKDELDRLLARSRDAYLEKLEADQTGLPGDRKS
jgi:hypothetical protein